jgi:hypothetical protein
MKPRLLTKADVESFHSVEHTAAQILAIQDASARRARLVGCVTKLAALIESGTMTPEPIELEALAQICERQFLRPEAARVRRWITTERR